MTLIDLMPAITRHATRHNLEPGMVRAIVMVESGGNIWAFNAEPRYRWLWDVRRNEPFRPLTAIERIRNFPPRDFPCLAGDPDAEWALQRASLGLMQLMGAVAREHGFRGPFLTQICVPEINLDLGCKHLAGLLRWAAGDSDKAIGAFNAGPGNWNEPAGVKYRAKVKAAMARESGE